MMKQSLKIENSGVVDLSKSFFEKLAETAVVMATVCTVSSCSNNLNESSLPSSPTPTPQSVVSSHNFDLVKRELPSIPEDKAKSLARALDIVEQKGNLVDKKAEVGTILLNLQERTQEGDGYYVQQEIQSLLAIIGPIIGDPKLLKDVSDGLDYNLTLAFKNGIERSLNVVSNKIDDATKGINSERNTREAREYYNRAVFCRDGFTENHIPNLKETANHFGLELGYQVTERSQKDYLKVILDPQTTTRFINLENKLKKL
jgi:hypothetical protein